MFEAKRVKHYEVKICQKSGAVLCAPNDTQQLKNIGIDTSYFFNTFHLGADEFLKLPRLEIDSHPLNILFVGTLTWDANRDAVVWFVKEVWPRIKSQILHVKFFIVGKFAADDFELKKICSAEGLHLEGMVDDLERYFNKTKIFIIPLRSGSGIKVKAVTGLYRGIPLVTTSVGIEGLDELLPNIDYQLADDPINFAEKCIMLLKKKSGLTEMASNTRATMSLKYSWDRVYREFENAIDFVKGHHLRRD